MSIFKFKPRELAEWSEALFNFVLRWRDHRFKPEEGQIAIICWAA